MAINAGNQRDSRFPLPEDLDLKGDEKKSGAGGDDGRGGDVYFLLDLTKKLCAIAHVVLKDATPIIDSEPMYEEKTGATGDPPNKHVGL